MRPKKLGLKFLGAVIFLHSCGWQFDTPTIEEKNAENVKLIAYLSDGNIDWKNVGELIVLESGEILHVRRNQIRPEPHRIVREWDDKFFKNLETTPPTDTVPLRLDRTNGVICNDTNCTTLYAICPSWAEMHKGQKRCVSFSRN